MWIDLHGNTAALFVGARLDPSVTIAAGPWIELCYVPVTILTLQDKSNTIRRQETNVTCYRPSECECLLRLAAQRFFLTEICEELRASRQTFWRWRQEGKIPAGYRHRHRRLLFTSAERQSIHEFANHLEPADAPGSSQLRLFNGPKHANEGREHEQ